MIGLISIFISQDLRTTHSFLICLYYKKIVCSLLANSQTKSTAYYSICFLLFSSQRIKANANNLFQNLVFSCVIFAASLLKVVYVYERVKTDQKLSDCLPFRATFIIIMSNNVTARSADFNTSKL